MINRIVRGVAGTLVILSLLLGYFVHQGFYLVTAFVALNLLQSAFSNWCLLISILKKIGVNE